MFDYNTSISSAGVHFSNSQYVNGIYNLSNFIVDGYIGDWVIIKLPNPIILTKINFIARSGDENRAPGEWKCYGSNDGSTFIEIIEASNSTRLSTTNYTTNSNVYTKNILNKQIHISL